MVLDNKRKRKHSSSDADTKVVREMFPSSSSHPAQLNGAVGSNGSDKDTNHVRSSSPDDSKVVEVLLHDTPSDSTNNTSESSASCQDIILPSILPSQAGKTSADSSKKQSYVEQIKEELSEAPLPRSKRRKFPSVSIDLDDLDEEDDGKDAGDTDDENVLDDGTDKEEDEDEEDQDVEEYLEEITNEIAKEVVSSVTGVDNLYLPEAIGSDVVSDIISGVSFDDLAVPITADDDNAYQDEATTINGNNTHPTNGVQSPTTPSSDKSDKKQSSKQKSSSKSSSRDEPPLPSASRSTEKNGTNSNNETLKRKWIAKDLNSITLAELYLLMGKPSVFRLCYDICSNVNNKSRANKKEESIIPSQNSALAHLGALIKARASKKEVQTVGKPYASVTEQPKPSVKTKPSSNIAVQCNIIEKPSKTNEKVCSATLKTLFPTFQFEC